MTIKIISIICFVFALAIFILAEIKEKKALKGRNNIIKQIADGDEELEAELKAFCDERMDLNMEISEDEIREIVEKHRRL